MERGRASAVVERAAESGVGGGERGGEGHKSEHRLSNEELAKVMGEAGLDVEQLRDIIRYAFQRFDQDGDGTICLTEFTLACGMLSMKTDPEIAEKLFMSFSRGKAYIQVQDIEDSFGENMQSALTDKFKTWYDEGLGKGAYLLDSLSEALFMENLSFAERWSLGLQAFRSQGELVAEFLEFMLATVLLVVKLQCVPDCKDLDATDIVPAAVLLGKSTNDLLALFADSKTLDLDEDSAAIFATVFKPSGFTVAAFQTLLKQTGARWVNLPVGSQLAVGVFKKALVLIGRGRIKIQERSRAAPALSETSVRLGTGSFLGSSDFLRDCSDSPANSLWENPRQYAVVTEAVSLLRWDMKILRKYLDTHEQQQKSFQYAFSRSTLRMMDAAREQSKKIATELPVFFRDMLLSMTIHFKVDRASLWVHNKENKILWTLFVLEDGSSSYFSIDEGSGLAGFTHKSGEMINIPDCYKDDRFNTNVDKSTGYYTQTMLCVPVIDKDNRGEIIGVIQLINKLVGKDNTEGFKPFGDPEEKLAEDSMWLMGLMVKQLQARYNAVL